MKTNKEKNVITFLIGNERDLRDRALNKVGSERVRSDVLAQPRVRG